MAIYIHGDSQSSLMNRRS